MRLDVLNAAANIFKARTEKHLAPHALLIIPQALSIAHDAITRRADLENASVRPLPPMNIASL